MLTALTWPLTAVTAAPGTDSSWQIGLVLGVSDGLVWGRDLVFTYGPLGFSVVPIAIDSTTLLPALLLAGATQFLMVAVLYVSLRRQYGQVPSAALTFFVAGAVGAIRTETTLVIGVGLALLALTAPRSRAREAAWALAIGGGAFAAFTLLVKLNNGIAVAAIVAVALAASPSPKRALGIGAASGAVTLLALWLIAGQPLGALADYARNGAETISGYVEAMGAEDSRRATAWQLLVLVGSAISLSVLAWRSFADLGRRRQGALVLVILLVHYFLLREIFVRHGVERGAFLIVLVPVALMIPWPRRRRPASLAVAAVLGVAFFVSFNQSVTEIWDPPSRTRAMVQQLRAGVDAERRDGLIAAGRAEIAAAYEVSPQVLAALRGHCVSVEPTEVAFVFLYELDWCPLPALQSYAAYTTRLDGLDAERYADPEAGPDRVARHDHAVDGRRPAWDSPEAMLSLLCHFDEVERGGVWQVLARVPDRCGDERPLATLRGRLGEPIAIPPAPPGTVLLAHVDGLQIGALERLAMLFGRPDVRRISVDGGPLLPGGPGHRRQRPRAQRPRPPSTGRLPSISASTPGRSPRRSVTEMVTSRSISPLCRSSRYLSELDETPNRRSPGPSGRPRRRFRQRRRRRAAARSGRVLRDRAADRTQRHRHRLHEGGRHRLGPDLGRLGRSAADSQGPAQLGAHRPAGLRHRPRGPAGAALRLRLAALADAEIDHAPGQQRQGAVGLEEVPRSAGQSLRARRRILDRARAGSQGPAGDHLRAGGQPRAGDSAGAPGPHLAGLERGQLLLLHLCRSRRASTGSW